MSTALIQSSSATTVIAVGFVGAGLLTFSQALGIIFGANIGTTITGWIVAVGGFKLNLGQVALPLVFLGTMLRLFGSGRWRNFGWALTGFSLLFIGIETTREGMATFEGVVTPDDFPEDTLVGRLQLVLIGIIITVVTQSSSAGVATALVALAAGTISFPQAAAMVIGMDVGTTFKAALATVGGSTPMRQTGYAHVIYNVMTGLMAFLLLTPLSLIVGAWAQESAGNAQIALVAFHSTFNTIGVLLVLPFTERFAALIQQLVPETGTSLVRHLDRRLLVDVEAACDAAVTTIRDVAAANALLLHRLLEHRVSKSETRDEIERITRALEQTRGFVEEIRTGTEHPSTHFRHQAAIHGLDHCGRLATRTGQQDRIETLRQDRHLQRLGKVLAGELAKLVESPEWANNVERFDRLRTVLRKERRSYRAVIIETASRERENADRTLAKLDSLRWMHRVAYHIWRILYHLDAARTLPLKAEDTLPAKNGQ